MSTKNVVLVLGNDAFASRVAELARDAGNIVTLAAPDAKGLDKIRTITTDPSSHDSLVAAFEGTFAAYGRINAVLSAFVPKPGAKDAIPGADQTVFRTALDPSIRVAKITLHYARRLAGDKTVTFLSVSGDGTDIMASTYAGGMVGAYRSYVPRYAAHDVVGALVSTDVADETAAQTLVQCIGARELAPTPPSSAAPIPPARIVGKSRILIIKDGVITPTDTFLGSPHGFQYNHIFQRMAGLAMKAEDSFRWRLRGGRTRTLGYLAIIALAVYAARRTDFLSRLWALAA